MDPDLDALREGCSRALAGHGPVRAADLLATIPADTAVDRYGAGGVVEELEIEVAGVLGLPAAAYLPSGTMAQQAVLRVHASQRGRRTVLFHPESHLDRHEGRYGRPPAEVAALFDTTYVSIYKGLGALAGCCLAGPQDVVDQVREWRDRAGGTLFGLWPGAASALTCLRRRLPQMPAYLAHARAGAAAVRDLDGVTVVPDPPQTPMLHLLLRTTAEAFRAAARGLAVDHGVWTWPEARTTGEPAVQRVELPVGDATLALTPEHVRDVLTVLVGAEAALRPARP